MKERQNMDPADQIAARATTDIEAIPFHPNPTDPVAGDDIAFDNDIPEVSTNAQPLPADSLVAPAVLDPHHFRVGDAIQFGYDPGGPQGIVTVAKPDDAGLIGIYLFGQDSRANVHCVAHASGCDPCRDFLAAYADRLDRNLDDWRSNFTPFALARADQLFESGLLLMSSDSRECGHGDRFVLAPDAELPQWFHQALAGAVLTGSEGGWPNWGRTCAPVDWPTLIDQHPDTLAPDHGMLESNEGASWEAIATAFGLLRAVDPKAAMDVSFWVDEQGRVLIDPMWICTTFEVPPELAASVDDLLVASGRPRRYIHDRVHDEPSDARTGWMVAC